MSKKIMMDMKLNSNRSPKSTKKQLPDQPIQEKPVPKTENIILQKEGNRESTPVKFSEDESLKKASVFVSGWQTPYPKKEPAEIKSVQSNGGYHTESKESLKRLSQTPTMKRKNPLVRKSILLVFVATVMFGLCYMAAVHFEKTSIVITKKQQMLKLDHEQFTAMKSAQAPIHFEIMIVSDTESKDIILTESQDVSTKAKGTVTFYNEFSTKPQTIALNSYIADISGKTYRTDKAVTIPGYKMNGTKLVPGQVSVGITAFLPGDSYNGTPKDFTISAFKGTTKFKKIYAKATTPLTGGAQGLVYVLGAQQKGNLNAVALSSFKSRLLNKVTAEVPKGYLLYPTALSFSYSIDEGIQSPTPSAQVKIQSTLSAVLLKEQDLSTAIVKTLLPNTTEKERTEIEIPDISKLNFAFVTEDQRISKDMESVSFLLSGETNALWQPNSEILKSQLLGALKGTLPSLFKTDPGIVEARATLFPPWKKQLPLDTSRIHITIQ